MVHEFEHTRAYTGLKDIKPLYGIRFTKHIKSGEEHLNLLPITSWKGVMKLNIYKKVVGVTKPSELDKAWIKGYEEAEEERKAV